MASNNAESAEFKNLTSYLGELDKLLEAQTLAAEQKIFFPRAATLFGAVAAITFVIVGITGNLVTIIALSRCRKLRVNATTKFVLSLCVTDLIFCGFNLPLTAVRYIREEWIFGETLCTLFPFFFYSNVSASLLCMVAITVNRYILISRQHLYDKVFRPLHVYLMVASTWLISFGMMAPPLFGWWGRLGLDPPTFSCTILKKNGRSPKSMLFIVGFLIPCLVIVASYGSILYRVRKSHHNSMGSSSRKRKSEEWRLTKMMIAIFCAFLGCFLPLMIVNVADDHVTVPWIHVIASVLAWGSSVINPFIYAFSNRQYRNAFQKLLCPHWPVILGGSGGGGGGCGGGGPGATNNRPSHTPSQSGRTLMTECIGQHQILTMAPTTNSTTPTTSIVGTTTPRLSAVALAARLPSPVREDDENQRSKSTDEERDDDDDDDDDERDPAPEVAVVFSPANGTVNFVHQNNLDDHSNSTNPAFQSEDSDDRQRYRRDDQKTFSAGRHNNVDDDSDFIFPSVAAEAIDLQRNVVISS